MKAADKLIVDGIEISKSPAATVTSMPRFEKAFCPHPKSTENWGKYSPVRNLRARADREITIVKLVGLGIQDLAIVEKALTA